MILYIHGFGGSGQGVKASAFRDYFGSQQISFMAPSLSYVPALAISTLEELIANHPITALIGSSLGGYYARYLAAKHGIKAVLINPSIHPEQTLSKLIGPAKNFYDESTFDWQPQHIDMLSSYGVHNESPESMRQHVEALSAYHAVDERQADLLMLLQEDDEVLDYREALVALPNAAHIIEKGGGHSYEGIERHFATIKNFVMGK